MRRALIDSTLSMLVAFAIVITLTRLGHMLPAMLMLLVSMLYPFLRIWLHRREITGS